METEAGILDYKQRLAQLPPDVLPTMHFIGQLPGMGEIHHDEQGYERDRYWFGKTRINNDEILLGISSSDRDIDYLLIGERAIELWKMEESSCNRLTFEREQAVFKPLLVDGQMEKTGENEYDRRYTSSLNFCSGDRLDAPFCSDCIFKEGKNEELRYPTTKGLGFWAGTIRAGYVDPKDFPVRRASDIRIVKREYDELKSDQNGFTDINHVFTVMGQIKDGIINAEMIPNEKAVTMLPDVAYNLGMRFRDLREK